MLINGFMLLSCVRINDDDDDDDNAFALVMLVKRTSC